MGWGSVWVWHRNWGMGLRMNTGLGWAVTGNRARHGYRHWYGYGTGSRAKARLSMGMDIRLKGKINIFLHIFTSYPISNMGYSLNCEALPLPC